MRNLIGAFLVILGMVPIVISGLNYDSPFALFGLFGLVFMGAGFIIGVGGTQND